ncbi:MAG: YqaJ viral recombinase family protein [Bdellovibrionaceae bacterium]|nr:YqaJ viral recombinase family protein [Pseudobdellovibrionaceae bacterium]
MKTLAEINAHLEAWGREFGLPIKDLEQQGSAKSWFDIRLGVATGSNASKIVAKKDSGTRATYMAELVAQVCTAARQEKFDFEALKWGREHEEAARRLYAFQTNNEIVQVGFVFKDESFRVGYSPDFLIKQAGVLRAGGGEIKCPFNSANYIKFATGQDLKSEYEWQMNFAIWVLGSEFYDFCQYDPRMLSTTKLHRESFAPDREKQKKLTDAVPEFIHDMDEMLKSLGVAFGDHWRAIREQQALAAVTEQEGAR